MNFSMDNSMAVLLPGSNRGALSDELTLTDADGGGVVIKDIQKDSPVGRIGTLKKGDQLNAVTIHFDNLNSKEVSKILKYSEPYKMSLKLNAKEELKSPGFRYRGPDMGLGDQNYLKLYNSKIKPHLKLAKPNMSVDGLDVDVNGKNKMPSIAVNGPRISSPDIDTNLKTASFDVNGPPGLNAKLMKPEFTTPSFHNTNPTVKGPGVDLDVKASVPKIAGGMMTSDIDIKSPKGVVDIKKPDTEFKGPSFGMPTLKMKKDMNAPVIEVKSPKGGFDVNMVNADLNAPKFAVPSTNFHGPNISVSDRDLDLKAPNVKDVDLNIATPNIDLAAPKIQADVKSPSLDIDAPNVPGVEGKLRFPKFKKPTFSILGHKPKVPEMDVSVPDMKTDIKAPDINIEGLRGGVDAPETKAKWKMPNLQMPSFGLSGPKGPDVDFDGSVKAPGVDVSVPNVTGNYDTPDFDIKLPKGDIDANIPGAELNKRKFTMPKFNLPSANLTTPDTNLNLKAPTVTSDVDAKLKLPKFKKPNLEISGIKGPNVNLGGNVKIPKADISAPEIKAGIGSADINLKNPMFGADYDMPDMNLEVPDVKLKGPGLKKPSLNMSPGNVSIPDVDLNLPTPNIDLAAPKIQADVKSPNLDINAPNIGDFSAEGKFKIPKFKKPTFSISGNKPKVPDLDVSVPELKTGITAPDVDIEGLKGGIDVPETKAKWKMPSLHMPSFGLSGPKVPDVDFDGSVRKPGVDVSVPNVKGNYETPNVGIKLPKGDIDAKIPDAELRGGKFRLPGFNLPSGKLSLSGPDKGLNMPKGQMDLSAPDLQGHIGGPSLDMKAPSIDINAPNVDVPETKAKFKMPSLQMPSFGLSGPKGPDVDFDGSVKAPGVDVSVPNVKGNFHTSNVGIKLPKGDVDANIQDTVLRGGKIKLPGFNLPSGKLSLSGPDKGLSMPKGQLDLSAPHLQGDIGGPSLDMKAPSIDVSAPNVDVPKTKAKFKMPSLQMPSFGLSGPKAPDVDFDGSVKAPGVDVSIPNVTGNYETPKVDIKLPKGDIDANIPDAELRGGKFRLPGINLPSGKLSLSGPDKGLNMPKGQLDLSAPDLEGDIRGPSLDMKAPSIDVSAPNVDVPETKAKWKMPKLELPSFGLSGPKRPDVDFDGSVRKPGVDVSVPNVKGNYETPDFGIKLPKGDIDANIPDAELNKPKFTMPSFNLPSAKLSTPDLNLKAPTVTSDVDAKLKLPKFKKPNLEISGIEGPNVNLGGNVKIPKADISAPEIKAGIGSADMNLKNPMFGADYDMPDMNLEVPDVKLKGPGLKKPSLNMSPGNVSIPDVDLNLPTPNIDLAAPKIQADVKSPNLALQTPSLDINAPNMDGFGAEKKFKFPKFKKPTFSISGHKPKVPDLDVSVPELKTGITAPDVDIEGIKGGVDVPETKAKFKMPSLHMPSFGLSGPKAPDVDFDGSVKAPGVDLSVPNVKGNYDTPKVDIKLPKGDIDENIPDAELRGGKIRLPGINLPSGKLSLSGPDKGLNMPKGQLDLSAPDLEGDIRSPSLDMKAPSIDVSAPNVDVPETKAKFKMPSLHMPSFGLSGPKAPDVDFDGSVRKPGVDVSVPNVKGNFETPDFGIKLSKGDIDANIPEAKFNNQKFSVPSLNLPSAKLSTPDTNLNLKAPTVTSDVDAKLKLPKFKKPNLEMSGIEGPNVNLGGNVKIPKADISAPEIKAGIGSADINLKNPMFGAGSDMPDMNLEVPDVKVKGPGLKKPALNMSPGNVSIPDVDLNLPEANIRGDAGINMPDAVFQEINLKGPNIGMKGAKFDVNSPNLNGGFREVGVDVSTPNPYAQLNAPKLNASSDQNVNMQNTFSRETFKVRSSSASDLDDAMSVPKNDLNLQARTSSTLNVSDSAMSKKSKFKFPKLFTFNHKSRGSVDFTKAQAAASSGTFTSKFPEIELALSND
uniref:neuroblast differentiation-associated protein AHNAK n=1 Tax=Pristiophorus japonicus TaxID=55135 RepID=UPI00398EEC54